MKMLESRSLRKDSCGTPAIIPFHSINESSVLVSVCKIALYEQNIV